MNKRTLQKQQTKDVIKRVAKRAFLENGIEATTTRDISRDANVAVGTFFVHYPDKLELVKEIFFEELEGALTRHAEQEEFTESPSDYLQQVAQTLFRFFGELKEFTQNVVLDSLVTDGFHSQQMKIVSAGIANRFERVGVDSEMAQLFADNMIANYWFVMMACLSSGDYYSKANLSRLKSLNLPFEVSYQNAAP
ncbi:TetR/AcrR family transcriptional regulator [Marinomonas mediterranea]|uniref:Regulatory protein TetR n=1 Tax=Marinomonas mediterranea (strain ATCC 700492 / JCM 21426 / NBRC 103028 / MMB-1) TaxID=717774 RepID=F2JZP7_MARM1|nr:TetR/AcrR family transcriptional regulator [Marinomonas mediterranea]ADZ90901.1 regulatory protein TetR [Marinomonas mediterranea MMB-1]WCN08948.1 TetR family transcriptional regulator [Marinomonas mediterranea]WCN17049.1 TetR family transcriptional regulator [Marinomonas mediterranea MMB-1]